MSADALRRLSRFLVVGVLNTSVCFLVFTSVLVMLRPLPFAVALAQGAGYATATLVSFACNRRWTFGSRAPAASEFVRFATTQAAMLVLSASALEFGATVLRLPVHLWWVVVTGGVTLVNFTAMTYWVFRRPQHPGRDREPTLIGRYRIGALLGGMALDARQAE